MNRRVLLIGVLVVACGWSLLHAGEQEALDHWVDVNLMMTDLAAHHNDLNLYLYWDVSNVVGRADMARKAYRATQGIQADIAQGRLFAGAPGIAASAGKILAGFEQFTLLLQQTNAARATISNAVVTAFSIVPEMVTSTEALHTLDPLALKATMPSLEGTVPQEVFEAYAEITIGCTPFTNRTQRLREFGKVIESSTNTYLQHACLRGMAESCFDDDKWGLKGEPPADTMSAHEAGLGYLETIVQTTHYSPALFRSWTQWRARSQTLHYGMSNWSEIPNHHYNSRRRHLARLVLAHLKTYPDDLWALNQLYHLCTHSNYERGGPFGHSGMVEICELTIPAGK